MGAFSSRNVGSSSRRDRISTGLTQHETVNSSTEPYRSMQAKETEPLCKRQRFKLWLKKLFGPSEFDRMLRAFEEEERRVLRDEARREGQLSRDNFYSLQYYYAHSVYIDASRGWNSYELQQHLDYYHAHHRRKREEADNNRGDDGDHLTISSASVFDEDWQISFPARQNQEELADEDVPPLYIGPPLRSVVKNFSYP